MGGGIVIANESDIGGTGFHHAKRHKGSIISVLSVLKKLVRDSCKTCEVRRRNERISNKDIRLCLPSRQEALV